MKLTLATTATAGAAICAIVAMWPGGKATEPEPVARFRTRLQTFDTVFATTFQVVRRRDGSIPMHTRGGADERLFRWDGARGVGTWQGSKGRWTYYDDHLTWLFGGPEGTPMEFGSDVDASIQELWEEIRDGMPNSTFTWVHRAPTLPDNDAIGDVWLVDLPFAWAAGFDVYVKLTDDAGVTRLGIHDPVAGKWLLEPVKIDTTWDVPLKDDFHERFQGENEGFGDHYFHDTTGVTSRFEFDPVGTGQPPIYPDPRYPTYAWTSAAWDSSCVKDRVTTKAVHLAFDWDPATAPSGDRALDAMAAGCRVGVKATTETRFTLTDGASAQFAGTVAVRDQAGVTLWSAPMTSNFTAPAGGGKRWTPVERKFDLPLNIQPQSLELTLDGTLTWRCTKNGPATNRVAVSLHDRGRPEMAWPGCWPEMGVLNVP